MKMSNCDYCSLSKSRIKVAMPRGKRKGSTIVMIGEAAGKNEDEQGKVFVGKAGQILDEIIDKLSLKKDRLYITNVVKCRPPNNRDPFPYEIDKCSHWLKKEISNVKPELIITLGKIATNAILNQNRRMDQMTGLMHYSPKYHCFVFPLLHPASLVYKKERKDRMDDDVFGFHHYMETSPITNDVYENNIPIEDF